jgi:hypothetical protein
MKSPIDGYYYALLSTWGTPPGTRALQQPGNCLIRTKDLNDGAVAWRAWGGSAFNVSLNADPCATLNFLFFSSFFFFLVLSLFADG